jgi:spoIIIJ-associated protein
MQEEAYKVKMLNQNAKDDASKPIDSYAKTVEEAIKLGLAQLGLPQEQVDIEVVSEGKRGVFGLGAEEAHVKLTPKTQPVTAVKPASDKYEEFEESFEAAPADSAAQPASAESVDVVAANYLSGLLERMGIKARVTARVVPELVEENEKPPLVLDITGNDLGILIGRRSETLQVLQYMVRLMVSKHFNRWEPVVVDVESYRLRRQRSLYQMAETMAERAVSTGRRVVLEAMPPHERRLIHLALRDHPKVYTKSVGSDENRKVTIVPK